MRSNDSDRFLDPEQRRLLETCASLIALAIASGITFKADVQTWQVGDGTGGAGSATADIVTNAPAFRDSTGTNAPRTFVLRQDAAMTDAAVPAVAQFGTAPPANYSIISDDSTLTLNSVTVTGGQATVNVLPFVNEGSTARITIGNLTRSVTNRSVVNFNGFTTNNSGGASTTGGQGLNTNGQIIVNAVDFSLAGAVTTNGSSTVTVPTTTGLFIGATVTGPGLPANERVASILSPTQFTVTTGTGVTAQAATTLSASNPIVNLAIANGPQPPLLKKRYSLKTEHAVKTTTEHVYRQKDDTVVMFSSSGWNAITVGQFYPPDRGKYLTVTDFGVEATR